MRRRLSPVLPFLFPTLLWLLLPGAAPAQEVEAGWPARVLIVNDDGIDSPGLLALVEAFAGVAETWVVAPAGNRSGSTNYMPSFVRRRFQAERRDLGEGVSAFALEGYPADCVFFALTGPMRGRSPDLVISGVNSGANLADAWFLSGTIGAARAATYMGVPAIAVSGMVEGDSEDLRNVGSWVVALARSPAVRRLEPPQYLTVDLPEIPPEEIGGVTVARRATGLYLNGVATAPTGRDRQARQANRRLEWDLEIRLADRSSFGPDTDVGVVADGRIAVVPMRVDEHDEELLRWLEEREDALPEWSAAVAVPEGADR